MSCKSYERKTWFFYCSYIADTLINAIYGKGPSIEKKISVYMILCKIDI